MFKDLRDAQRFNLAVSNSKEKICQLRRQLHDAEQEYFDIISKAVPPGSKFNIAISAGRSNALRLVELKSISDGIAVCIDLANNQIVHHDFRLSCIGCNAGCFK